MVVHDDEINMYTGRMINNNKMTTVVTSTGSGFSGWYGSIRCWQPTHIATR
ncbi:hypothetical protein O9929_13465 [Vibrio lentus]|nr:hypothetical protein [Vibrio lentus]